MSGIEIISGTLIFLPGLSRVFRRNRFVDDCDKPSPFVIDWIVFSSTV